MSDRGLLSRLRGRPEPADEVESIVAHLRSLLNSRRGQAPSAPMHGVIDFSDAVQTLQGGVQLIAASMRATIAEHEPRLKAVNVRHVSTEGELVLRFEVVAHLPSRDGRTIRLSTTVRPGGHVDVAA